MAATVRLTFCKGGNYGDKNSLDERISFFCAARVAGASSHALGKDQRITHQFILIDLRPQDVYSQETVAQTKLAPCCHAGADCHHADHFCDRAGLLDRRCVHAARSLAAPAAADAAARAGAQTLSTAQDEKEAVKKAIEIAAENVVAGESFKLAAEDVEIGKSVVQTDGSWDFVPGGQPYSAIRVNAERTAASAAGPVRLLVGGILGRQTYEPRHVATASQVDQDVVLVIDRSGSMAWDLSGRDGSYPRGGAECNDPHATLSRWAAARAAVDEFLISIGETRPQEQVAIVSFSTDISRCGMNVKAATIDSDLSLDYSKAKGAMTRLSSKPIPGGTNISAGIDLGVKAFKGTNARSFAQKTMIVMTDGQWNAGRRPVDAARDAAAEGITVHTITFCAAQTKPT